MLEKRTGLLLDGGLRMWFTSHTGPNAIWPTARPCSKRFDLLEDKCGALDRSRVMGLASSAARIDFMIARQRNVLGVRCGDARHRPSVARLTDRDPETGDDDGTTTKGEPPCLHARPFKLF